MADPQTRPAGGSSTWRAARARFHACCTSCRRTGASSTSTRRVAATWQTVARASQARLCKCPRATGCAAARRMPTRPDRRRPHADCCRRVGRAVFQPWADAAVRGVRAGPHDMRGIAARGRRQRRQAGPRRGIAVVPRVPGGAGGQRQVAGGERRGRQPYGRAWREPAVHRVPGGARGVRPAAARPPRRRRPARHQRRHASVLGMSGGPSDVCAIGERGAARRGAARR
eukprot:5569574-Prymnesium_polylepis.1